MSHNGCTVVFAWLSIFAALPVAVPAEARIIRIDITRTESPTFDGQSFGEVGPYEKLVGRASGELDPADPRNQPIVDLMRGRATREDSSSIRPTC